MKSSISAIVPWNEFDTIWEAHMQQLIPCKLCGRKFFPDRIVVHEKSCKGDRSIKGKTANNANNNFVNNNNNNNNNVTTANVDLLLSTPMTIRRQLHSQTDAVKLNKEQTIPNEEMDRSQSD